MHDDGCNVKHLIPNISNRGQLPLIQKSYGRPILWINIWSGQTIPSLIQKENPTSQLDWDHMPVSPTFISAVWPSHASLLSKIRLRFKVRESCSSMSVVIHSFCLTNIHSKPWANSWSAFFFSYSLSSLQGRSFEPSVVVEEPSSLFRTSTTGTFSFDIVAFPRLASLGTPCSCLAIFAFALDRSSTWACPSKSSNFSFPSLIRSQTLYLSAVQFSVGWPGFPPW